MEQRKPRIGIMTSGGDCPGLNAAIRACAKTAIWSGYEVIGIHNGWEGLLEHDDEVLSVVRTSGIIDRGGTILGTSRVSPLRIENGVQRVKDRFNVLKLEALVVLGGNGGLSLAYKMFKQGIPLVGIPKTIDNDVTRDGFLHRFPDCGANRHRCPGQAPFHCGKPSPRDGAGSNGPRCRLDRDLLRTGQRRG